TVLDAFAAALGVGVVGGELDVAGERIDGEAAAGAGALRWTANAGVEGPGTVAEEASVAFEGGRTRAPRHSRAMKDARARGLARGSVLGGERARLVTAARGSGAGVGVLGRKRDGARSDGLAEGARAARGEARADRFPAALGATATRELVQGGTETF